MILKQGANMSPRMLVVLLAISLSGCSHVAERYQPSTNNLAALRAIAPAKISVGRFTEAPTVAKHEVGCGANSISPPDGQSFAEYVRAALISELRLAGIYSETSSSALSGQLTEVSLDSSPFAATATWILALELQGNGKTVAAADQYSFRSTTMNTTSCEASTRRLHDAVQNVVSKAIQDRGFPGLLTP